MTRKPTQEELAQLVRREVIYCVSSLVYELAHATGPLSDQALDLCAPLLDYEKAATDAGWESYVDEYGADCWRADDGDTWAGDAEDLCREFGIEPYEREIFEHWIVSDWLADKLDVRGERIDRDFAGLTVWGRTTTGQAIALDYIIEQIWLDLHRDDKVPS